MEVKLMHSNQSKKQYIWHVEVKIILVTPPKKYLAKWGSFGVIIPHFAIFECNNVRCPVIIYSRLMIEQNRVMIEQFI